MSIQTKYSKTVDTATLAERYEKLKSRLSEIPGIIEAEEAALAETLANGADGADHLSRITALDAEKRALPAAINAIRGELQNLAAAETRQAIEREKSEAEKIIRPLFEQWEKIRSAVEVFKRSARESGLSSVKGYAVDPLSIVEGFQLPDLPAKIRAESNAYFDTVERSRTANAIKKYA